jgi:PAS domain S-box-containing protein
LSRRELIMALDVVSALHTEAARPTHERRVPAADGREAVLQALPRLAAALATRPGLQVIADLTAETLRPLHAAGAAVIAVHDDGSVFDVAASGVSDTVLDRLGPMVLDGNSPILSALSKRQAIWLDSRDRVAELFPQFAALDVPWQAYTAAPLLVDGRIVGAVAIPFASHRRFTAVDRTCIRSVYALIAHSIDQYRHATGKPDQPHPPLRPLLERMADGVVVRDVRVDRIVYANPAMEALTGLDRAVLTTMGRNDIAEHLCTRWNDATSADDTGAHVASTGVATCSITAADGSERELELHHSDVDHNGYRMTVVLDVTGRANRAEQVDHLCEAVWVERDRLARDLHDGVVQSVFATSLTLAAAALRAPASVRGHIEDAIDGLDGVVQQLRSTVFGLARPSSVGGDAADLLRTIAEKAARGLGFHPTVECVGDVDRVSDPELLGHLVLAAREALSNVARHAKATAVGITLDVCDRSVDLIVADNGIGVPIDHRSGDGIDNLRRRAEECGGSCTIASHPGAGTTVRWSVPLAPTG